MTENALAEIIGQSFETELLSGRVIGPELLLLAADVVGIPTSTVTLSTGGTACVTVTAEVTA